MKVRSMISNIFGNKKIKYKSIDIFKLLNDSSSAFYTWNGKLYDNNTVRTAIGTNGINAGKLNPKHVRRYDEEIKVSPNRNLERILKCYNLRHQ